MRRARRRCPASSATARSSSPTCSAPRANSARSVLATGHYVVNRAARRTAATRSIARTTAERDQSYFLFATTRDAARHAALSARRPAEGASARAGARVRSRDRRQAGQPGHLLRADRALRRRHRAAQAGRGGARRHRRSRPASVLGQHDGIIHFTVGQRQGPEDRRARAALCRAARSRHAPRRGRPARRARDAHDPSARRELDRRRRDRGCAGERREVFVKVRSTRPPRPAWLSLGRDGVEVELVDGEEGVAPGQACVFYDAAEGEARVLGGGFIRSDANAAQLTTARHGARSPAATSESLRALRRGGDGGHISTIGARSKRPMRAGRRSTTRVRQGVRARPQGRDRGGRARRRAHSRSRRRHRHFAAGLRAHQPPRRHRYLGADAAQGAGARRRASASPTSKRSP